MRTLRRIVNLLLPSLVTLGTALQMAAVANCQAAGSATAAKWTSLAFDTARTTIAYKLIGWPHVTDGTFKLKSGVIQVDAISGKMAGEIVVEAASGDSGHSVRDARMRDSILEAARYPEISYAPQQVESHGEPGGEFPVIVRGVMTLHGGPHQYTIRATVERRGDDATIRCRFAIPYVAWGLKNPSILLFKVEPNVTIEVTATAHVIERAADSVTWRRALPGAQ